MHVPGSIGYHRCAPSAGGLTLALGTCEWAPTSATDALAIDVEARVGALVSCVPHALDGGIKLQYTHFAARPGGTEQTSARAKDADKARAPEGAHLDTNKRPHRHCTVLIYLNDVGEGGETVFPLAGLTDEAAHGRGLLKAARLAAAEGKHHTHDKSDDESVAAALKAINVQAERAAAGDGGLKVQPRKGLAVVFYSMGADGDVDPQTFHFGASLTAPGAGKWTMQFFKELPADARSAAGRAAYAREVHPLNRMATVEQPGMVEVD